MKTESLLERAYWIWPGLFHDAARNVYADFRCDFRIRRKKGPARLAITADQSYMLYVNGSYIGRGPARGYQWSWPYDEYDLNECVRPGHNWISVRMYNAGCGTFQYLHQGAYGMICAGEICGERILSGEGWTGRVSAANRRDTAKLSVQLNCQEWMDAQIDDQGWIQGAKHPLKQEGPMHRRPYGVMPWHRLERRGIPNLGRELLSYQRVIAAGNGQCDARYKDDNNLTTPWYREIKGMAWKETSRTADKPVTLLRQPARDACPSSARESGRPGKALWLATGRNGVLGFPLRSDSFGGQVAGFRKGSTCVAKATPAEQVAPRLAAGCFTLEKAGLGRLQAIVLDMGRPTIGTLMVEVEGGKGGEILDFFFCEVASPDGTPVLCDPKQGCAVSMSARLILCRRRTQHEFYQMIGHRYVVALARETKSSLKIKLRLRETVYPLKIKGRFRTGDSVLEDIYRICIQTQQVCCLDSYVDTPWREQAQWWGDARVQAQNTIHLGADVKLLARGIRSVGTQMTPNGLTYGHAPTVAHNCVLPDFSLIWILTIWDYYYQTGEIGLFKEQYERVEKVLNYFRSEGRSKNGLLRYDRRYWLFLDWSDLPKEGHPALLNLWYVMALEKTAQLAALAGMRREQAEIMKEHRDHCRRVVKAFWDEKEELFRDGLKVDGKKEKKEENYSIHTQTLAILCGLQSSRRKAMIEKRLRPYLCGNNISGAKPSSYWVTYVYEVMKRLGYGLEVVKHIREKWAPMISCGGTWETFDIQFGVHSVSHAWAAHPLYHLAGTLGGVLQNETAWKKIIFHPVIMPEYRFAEAIVPTPQGTIKSRWEARGGKVEVALELPPGIRADVLLPGAHEQITGKKKWIIAPGEQTGKG